MKKILFFVSVLIASIVLLGSCDPNEPSSSGGTGTGTEVPQSGTKNYSEQGMYVGITGFSDDVEFYNGSSDRYAILTQNNSNYFTSFINSLSMGDATVLYYAVDNNLSYLAKCKFPDDLTSVNIITFTDGLDQGSRAFDKQDGNHDYAANNNSYVAAINEKLNNTKVGGLPITAYAIGIRGKDVQGDAIQTFSDNLVKLSSSKENAMEVSDMDEVNAKFKEIAESLYKKSESRDLTITIPMPSENEKERFTFDDVSSATDSKCYLEGVYANGALKNITYVGCMSNSGSEVKEKSAGVVKISFVFENFTDTKGNAISTTSMQQWHMEQGQSTWTRNSEFEPTESTVVTEDRKTAVIMLILDCSSSLGTDFSKVKVAATNFIKTLAGEINGTNPIPDPNSVSQVRFCKEQAYERVLMMTIDREENGEYVNSVAEYEFGTGAGTTSYYEIPSGSFYPSYYYVSDDDEYTGWYYALDEPYYYDFAANKKYTFSCGDDGTYLTFTITLDGNANVPAKVVETRRIAKSELIKLNRVRK